MLNGNEKVSNNFKEKPNSPTNDTSNHHHNHQTLHIRSSISSKPIIPISGQMFLILRRSSSLIALLVVVISSMLTTLSPDGRGVDAGLIQIYHKYKAGRAAESPPAADTSEDSLNSSAAIEQSILEDGQVVDLLPEPSSRSIEYTSPMKRIMELIGHHSPVIVVSSDSSPQQPMNPSQSIEQQMVGHGGQQQIISTNNKGAENPMATFVQTALLPANHMQPQPQPATSSPEHQQWTLVDSNQALMPSAMLASPQQHHHQQQQQFIQTAALPAYEQYYLAPSHQLSADHAVQAHHLAMMPGANLGFSPANSYQQIASMSPSFSPAGEAHHQAAQQAAASFQAGQQSMQQNKNLDDRAQPVFLSSYVPEITVPAKSLIQPEVPVEKRPNSIQQAVQYSQDSQQQKQQSQQQQQQQQPIQTQASTSPTLTPSAGNTMQKVPVAQARSSSQPAEGGNDSSLSSDNDMADEGDSDSGSRAGNSDESEDGDSSGDIEEPSKIKRSHTAERQAQGSQARQLSTPNKTTNSKAGDSDSGNQEDPSSGGNGYMSYEDKYDSDKDEPRSVSTSHSPRATDANEIVANGLINVGLNDDCLQCICRASSGCDQLLRCITRGSEEKYCGPFQLTEEYWNMAGKPKDDNSNFQSFEDCANEVECAVETVTNYMKKYHKDCDGDENITCMDYARLHRLRPDECGNTKKLANSFDAYWAKFQRCAEGYNRSRTGDDEEI